MSYEPNVYAFPTDEPPADISTDDEMSRPHLSPIQLASPADVRGPDHAMPIQVVFLADNIQRDVAQPRPRLAVLEPELPQGRAVR